MKKLQIHKNPVDPIWFDESDTTLCFNSATSGRPDLKIFCWDDGLRLYRFQHSVGKWYETEKHFHRLVFPLRKWDCLNPFVRSIPKQVVTTVGCFKYGQFVLLKMVRTFSGVLDLLKDNPVLAWLIADQVIEQKLSVSDAAALAMQKRREILRRIGLESSDYLLRLLGMIRFKEYTQKSFITVKKMLANHEELDCLRRYYHPARILYNLQTVDLFYQLWWVIRKNNRHRSEEISGFESLWEDTLELLSRHNVANRYEKIFSCNSVDALQRLHDRYVRNMYLTPARVIAEEFRRKYASRVFPAPPVAGTDTIVPIANIRELIDEGRTMHHCVAAYADRIMRKSCCIYRMTVPERVTIEIVMGRNGYRLKQARTICNGHPKAPTEMVIANWLMEHSGRRVKF